MAEHLTAEVIEGFVTAFLHSKFDNPQPIPEFHRKMWRDVTSQEKRIAIAAPRGHGKSTALTHSFVLAALCFRTHDFVMVFSNTFAQSVEFLGDLRREVTENDGLMNVFGIKGLSKDCEDEIVIEFHDGKFARVIAKSAEQDVRGIKWRNKRPNLIMCDDMEGDEQVESKKRRDKFKNWFTKALLPAGSDHCKIILVGTILHFDSLLQNLIVDPEWKTSLYRAHKDFDDFSEVLWPGKHTEETLRKIRAGYINQGQPDGYSQEYLNEPMSAQMAYFKKEDMLELMDMQRDMDKKYYAAWDFAISKDEGADYTAGAVIGVDSMNNWHVVEIRRGRFGIDEIVEEVFIIQQKYKPIFTVMEKGALTNALGPVFNEEMRRKGVFLSLEILAPTKDKTKRARALQSRLRARTVYFDKQASWYPAFEDEFLRFPKASHDDQVDALAWIGLKIDDLIAMETPEELEGEDYQEMRRANPVGRSLVCGY